MMRNTQQDAERRPIRILSVDGSDLYRAMHRVDGPPGLTVKDKKGKLDTSRFRGFLDASIDTDRMRRVYAAHQELPGRFKVCKEYTTAVVSVSFDYAVKAYYNRGKRLYVRHGYSVTYEDLTDHVCVGQENGRDVLLAIEVAEKGDAAGVYTPVKRPADAALLGNFFAYDADAKQYRTVRKKDAAGRDTAEVGLSLLKKKKAVRRWLYEHGFDIDGVHYVRYKRSAGSSREGHCLFIAEPLYDDMMQWSACGLDPAAIRDQASWQAYISLTLSSIEKRIDIPKTSVLLIRDQVSRFRDNVVRVTESKEDPAAREERTGIEDIIGTEGAAGLDAREEHAVIENVIWDGEALLDRSVFDKNGYADKGMMLLRNRFFKTCAFNTNLQQWFADHHITDLEQLNGYHAAETTRVKDIKLVITESSLKYLKFKPDGADTGDWFRRWLDNVFADGEDAAFGVVKTDKPGGPMNNRMVRTNYQLLNTLQLTEQDVARVLAGSLDFLHKIQRDPMYLRYYGNLFVSDSPEVDADSLTADNYRQKLISDIMRRTDDFEGTVFYRSYRAELCQSIKERLKHGRIPVDGGYHTLFGNGPEFLRAVIDKNYVADAQPPVLADGEIFTRRFADGQTLLCVRSPHITMGNLFVAKNKYVPEIEKYFNPGAAGAIVCVNAVGSNLQQRLNGCDYDSDAMLITDEPTLLKAALAGYDRFPVPFCAVLPGSKKTYTTSPEDLTELDVQIAENRIGEIVNLSQFLNSLYWDAVFHGATREELAPKYGDICKLAVLSGMEIDKAKRLYPVSSDNVVRVLRRDKDDYKKAHDGKIPPFFAYMTETEAEDAASPAATLDTAMSFIYDAVRHDRGRSPRSKTVDYVSLFDLDHAKGDPTGVYGKRRDAVLDFVSEAQKKIRRLNFAANTQDRAEKALAAEQVAELFEACLRVVAEKADDRVYYLLLRELDKREESKKSVTQFHSLLFAVMCYANDGYLMKKLRPPTREMYDLIPADESALPPPDEVVYLFGHPHVRGRRRA